MNPPYLIADASAWSGPSPAWSALAAHPNMVGIIIKATQGTNYAPAWFRTHWPKVRDVGGTRYGSTWFRGAYHYLNFDTDGRAQADYYLAAIEAAGGWGDGDILPIVDVERGKPGSSNYNATAEQIIACTTAFAKRVKEVSGRGCILYGRGAMRDLGITSRMGCVGVWNPGYTQSMPLNGLEPAWSRDDVVLWQYAGDGDGDPSSHRLPLLIDGFSTNLDVSVYVDGARKPTLDSLRRRLVGNQFQNLLACALLVLAALVGSRFVA